MTDTNQITANFNSVKDFMHCPCGCNAFIYDKTFMKRIQILRDIVDLPFYLDQSGGSFYRCRLYQESIGGVKNSQHLLGRAMDISTHGWGGSTRHFIIEQAMHLDLSMGIYSSFIHLDLRRGTPVLFHGDR